MKVRSSFQIKYQTIKDHKHDIINHRKWSVENCLDHYNGEITRRISEKIEDYTGRDAKLNLQQS